MTFHDPYDEMRLFKEKLLALHWTAVSGLGPHMYHEYAMRMLGPLQSFVDSIKLRGAWVIPEMSLARDNLVFQMWLGLPNGSKVRIPDIADWETGQTKDESCIEETVKFFVNLVEDFKVNKMLKFASLYGSSPADMVEKINSWSKHDDVTVRDKIELKLTPSTTNPPLEVDPGPCECEGDEWLHMGEPFEIHRCDLCCGKDGSDDEARLKHREDCGCDWPEVDYRSFLTRHIGYLPAQTIESSLLKSKLQKALLEYDQLHLSVPVLLRRLGEYYCHIRETPDISWRDDVEYLDQISAHVLEFHAMVFNSTCPPGFDKSYDSGVVDEEGRWFVNQESADNYHATHAKTHKPVEDYRHDPEV